MKKFFITLLLAIIGIGSSMAQVIEESWQANTTDTKGVFELKGMANSVITNPDSFYVVKISLFVEREDTLDGTFVIYCTSVEEAINDSVLFVDSIGSDTVYTPADTIIDDLGFVTYISADTIVNDVVWISTNTQSIIKGKYSYSNYSDVKKLDDYGIDMDKPICRANYNITVNDDGTLKSGSYIATIQFFNNYDVFDGDYIEHVPFTVSNTQSISNTSILSTSQWRKEIRNGMICIVNDNNDTAYNMYGMKVK